MRGGGDLGGGCEDGEDGDGCQIDVGGGPMGKVQQGGTWSTTAVAHATFVTPVQACSSYQSIAPRFGIGRPTADQQHVWNLPSLSAGKSRPVKSTSRRLPRCQDGSHYKKCAVPYPEGNE